MADTTDQDQARQEALMAGGPVSAGASNESAPMNQGQNISNSPPDQSTSGQDETADYNKLIQQRSSGTPQGSGMATDRNVGSPGGGTDFGSMGSETTRGGISTSDSTVSSGGSSSGGVIGAGSTTDRGRMTNRDADTSTNTEQQIKRGTHDDPSQDHYPSTDQSPMGA